MNKFKLYEAEKQKLLKLLVILLFFFLSGTAQAEPVGIITNVSYLQGNFSYPPLTIVQTTKKTVVLWDILSVPLHVDAFIFSSTDLHITTYWFYWSGSATTYRVYKEGG